MSSGITVSVCSTQNGEYMAISGVKDIIPGEENYMYLIVDRNIAKGFPQFWDKLCAESGNARMWFKQEAYAGPYISHEKPGVWERWKMLMSIFTAKLSPQIEKLTTDKGQEGYRVLLYDCRMKCNAINEAGGYKATKIWEDGKLFEFKEGKKIENLSSSRYAK